MWTRFTERFSFAATPATSIVFKPDGGPLKDGRYLVTRRCAAEAIAAGKATTCDRPTGALAVQKI